ncbi:hypothetical protein D3C87_1690140 [compost metagenome]
MHAMDGILDHDRPVRLDVELFGGMQEDIRLRLHPFRSQRLGGIDVRGEEFLEPDLAQHHVQPFDAGIRADAARALQP